MERWWGSYPYQVELAPGCHGEPDNPVISRHRTWDAARKKALCSDRLLAVNLETGEEFQIPGQDDPHLGNGRYGNGITLSKAKQLGIW